jgi:quercetin dioxygenase-like cupin family protein
MRRFQATGVRHQERPETCSLRPKTDRREEPMKVVTAKDMQTGAGPEDWFTGTVWRDAAPTGSSPDVAVNRVLFEPGARTHWHTHPEGQILYIITGTCRAGKEGEVPVEVEAGGVVYFAPDEKHWHGSTPDTYMVHMAINVATTTDGGTGWLEPVTDEEYAGEQPAR